MNAYGHVANGKTPAELSTAFKNSAGLGRRLGAESILEVLVLIKTGTWLLLFVCLRRTNAEAWP